MGLMSAFKLSAGSASPLVASGGSDPGRSVSGFITVQSFTNFAAMTGALLAAWKALQVVLPGASALWVPYALAGAFGLVSLLISLEGLKRSGSKGYDAGDVAGAVLVAFFNSLVLAGAVVGTGAATR